MFMRTGKDVTRTGMYSSACCIEEKQLEKDGMFPRCPKCLKLTVWEYVITKLSGALKGAA